MASSLAMRIPLLFVTFALLVHGACGGKKDEEKVGNGTGAEVGTKLPPAVVGVELLVGDKVVGTVDDAKAKDWPRLDTLLPEEARRLGKWHSVIVTVNGKPSELKPFEACRDCVPALYPSEGGGISFGMFDPVELGKRGTPGLHEDKITRLVVKLDEDGNRGGNDHQGGEVIDPAHVKLKITTAKGSQELSGDKLLGVEREAQPGGGDAKGWRLGALLKGAGVETFKKVTLVDASGTSIPIEAKEISDSNVPFIKLNRQGALRFRVYTKQGEGWQNGGELRSLVEIKVE